jgi:hypothetical protein
MSEPNEALKLLVGNVLAAACTQSNGPFCDALRDALNALARSGSLAEGRRAVASQLSKVTSPVGAGNLAVWLGAGVEAGIDPEPTALPILDAMLRWTRTLQTTSEGELAPDQLRAAETLAGLEELGQGLVAHLARSPSHRTYLQAREDWTAELERVEQLTPGSGWVLELLRKRSGQLVVLHVEQRRGFRVTYENLSNCFHLFTLLQAALDGKVPDARAAEARSLAVARGEAFEAASDSACWHYGRGDVSEASFAGSIWGEGSPSEIPQIDGTQVLLLWPPLLGSRSWDAGFFGPYLQAMPPSVVISEELTAEQVDAWWAKLKLPMLEKKPKWKFW